MPASADSAFDHGGRIILTRGQLLDLGICLDSTGSRLAAGCSPKLDRFLTDLAALLNLTVGSQDRG